MNNDMRFDYIVGKYNKKNNAENVMAGFLNINDAKSFAENVFLDSLAMKGFLYIDAPEGKYILGEKDYRNSGMRWYGPAEWENTIVYDVTKDRCVGIDAFVNIDKYYEIQKFQKGRASVLDKLKENQAILSKTKDVNNLEYQRTHKER